MSIIGKLIIVIVMILALWLLLFYCDHTWHEENHPRHGRRWRCHDCGAETDEQPEF